MVDKTVVDFDFVRVLARASALHGKRNMAKLNYACWGWVLQVTGSYDYTIRLYDFHGMKSDMRSFRSAFGGLSYCIRSSVRASG